MPGLRRIARGILFLLWCAVMVPLQIIVMIFTRGPAAYTLPFIWQRGMCRILGLKVIVEGAPISKQQTLFVANHVSYLDIPVMGSVLKASFIAKKEVAEWPVFGILSRMQQTAFISRSRSDAYKGKNALSMMLAEGKSLILFPEGTSTDGRGVVPFKSSLFSITLDDASPDMVIQPFTLFIDSVDGKSPDDQAVRDLYAWYGDMTLPPHLSALTGLRGVTIRLIFHPVIKPTDFQDRKALADACAVAVRAGLETANVASRAAA